MGVLKKLCRIVILIALIALTAFVFGQDAPETQAPAGQGTTAAPAPTSSEDSELAAEVQQLRNELERLKRQVAYLNSVVAELENERAPVERAATRPSAKAPKKSVTPGSAPEMTADAPAPPDVDEKVTKTILVFRDGHKTEAVNYAIVGQTLWIYTETDSKKMPLADLDVAATKSANSDRGVTFQVPATK